ncbi:exodeoxyribonuclease III [Verrucomicrobiota bacterium sgz303538]
MRIATWNVNGIRARQEQLREWIAQDSPEVVCLQEIKASPEQVPASLRELDGYWSYWHGAKGYSGVALLIRKELCNEPPQFSHPHFDHENRIATVLIGEITIASVYVPNGGKDFRAKMRFLTALEEYVAAFQATGDALVLSGDMNVTRAEIDVHPKERRNVICQLPQERAAFDRILRSGLIDVGRELEPENEGLFTWWAPWRGMRQRNIGWRLDYILASADVANKARSCTVRSEVGTSDHAPVVAAFEQELWISGDA